MTKPVRIVRDHHIMHGQPCVSDTRIPTEAVADLVNAGFTVTQIREQYPSLDVVQIAAAWRYENSPRRRLGRKVADLRMRIGCWFLGLDVDDVREIV